MGAKQREVKYEILRIIAMGMIIVLHYLSKGGFLTSLKGEASMTVYLAWLIEAFCLVAVNVYVLISGYFGCMAEWRISKLLTLWLQVLFYALVVGVFVLLLGLADPAAWNMYEVIKLVFPIVTEHYWFATSYVLLFVLIPFLKAGVEKVTQKELGLIIVILLLVQSVAKSVLPVHLPWDKLGYDAWWFVTLFLIGAYLRRYDITLLNKKLCCLILYVACSVLTFGTLIGINVINLRMGKLEDFTTYAYAYNHILCLLASIGLFGLVKNIKEKQLKPQSIRIITKISGATFGVYLLHEHLFIRYQWPAWLGVERFHGTTMFILHMLLSVVIVFAVGVIVELIRQNLFKLVTGRH